MRKSRKPFRNLIDVCLLILALCLLIFGGGRKEPAVPEAQNPDISSLQTEHPDRSALEADLQETSAAFEDEALPDTQNTPAGTDDTFSDAAETAPEAEEDSGNEMIGEPVPVSIGDLTVMSDVTELDISGTDVFWLDMDEILDSLPNLKKITMINCGMFNEGYAQLQDNHPDVRIIWEIEFSHWTVRTDAVAFSTYRSTTDDFSFKDKDAYYLKYCTDLVALDLGHNYVTDLSFLEYMPELKILILADNYELFMDGTYDHIRDISALKNCPKLRYLEIFVNSVSDISVFQYLTDLEDLNISYNPISDIEYLKNLPHLQRLWMEHTDISYDDYVTLTQIYPDAEIVYYGEGSVDQGWREGAHYEAMRRMFEENTVDEIYRSGN